MRHTPSRGRPRAVVRSDKRSRQSSGALQLLYGPTVSVGILEEAEARARRALGPELLHIADRNAAANEFLTDGVDVVDHELDALDEPGSPSGRPSPITTEHAEPGGVICTTRIRSFGRMSWSRWKPTFSV